MHPRTDILVIATCAMIAGADEWDEIAECGRTKEPSFRWLLALPHGFRATTRSSVCSSS
ncbi:transposase family protein [Gemmata sp. SH-PL17]|uniref:transposase family protein n=1 Tax=Gemmata sp. SH-PL17 TaxID=1630693 RepID=UPI0004B409A1|nr:transposase family protein [Gemmata sp. SH-PL17]